MSYVSTVTAITDVTPQLPQTTTASRWTQTATLIDSHATRASQLIDGYLAKRYSVPFSPVPPAIITIAEDITLYYTLRSLYGEAQAQEIRRDVRDLYEDSIQYLIDIRDGKQDLVATSGALLTESGSTDKIYSSTENHPTFFNIDDELNWDWSKAQKDAIER